MREGTLALEVAQRHDRLAALAVTVLTRLRAIEVTPWRGPAAEAYREDLAHTIGQLVRNAQAHEAAAGTWRRYAAQLASAAAAQSAVGGIGGIG